MTYQNCSSYPTHLSFHPWTKSSKSTTWTRRNNPAPNLEVVSAARYNYSSPLRFKRNKATKSPDKTTNPNRWLQKYRFLANKQLAWNWWTRAKTKSKLADCGRLPNATFNPKRPAKNDQWFLSSLEGWGDQSTGRNLRFVRCKEAHDHSAWFSVGVPIADITMCISKGQKIPLHLKGRLYRCLVTELRFNYPQIMCFNWRQNAENISFLKVHPTNLC